MGRARILVVDDEPFNLEIVSEYLADNDYLIDAVESGELALARLADESRHYDLVVLDRMMPGLDGIEVLRRMKREERLQAIPVIMQTAAATPDQVREGLASGAHYYLTKPFEAGALQAIIRTALADRARRAELSSRIAEHQFAMQLIQSASFSFRSVEEAAAVATTAALVCGRVEAVAMGLAELLVNGVEHGNLGIDFALKAQLKEQGGWEAEVSRRLDLPEYAHKRVRLDVAREATSWHFTVRDEGVGFDWKRFAELAPERAFMPNGRGIVIARQLAFSRLEYAGCGNEVHAWADDPDEVKA